MSQNDLITYDSVCQAVPGYKVSAKDFTLKKLSNTSKFNQKVRCEVQYQAILCLKCQNI